jgi:hypothetical protein
MQRRFGSGMSGFWKWPRQATIGAMSRGRSAASQSAAITRNPSSASARTCSRAASLQLGLAWMQRHGSQGSRPAGRGHVNLVLGRRGCKLALLPFDRAGLRARAGRPAGHAHRTMTTIYRKTTKGQAEIETRAHRLAPRLRSLLVMVDGKRSDADFAQMLPQAAEALAALAQDGFIAEQARVDAPVQAPATAVPARDVSGATVSRPAAAPAQFEAMRRDLLRAFNDSLGPAGERMAIKLERARNEGEFRALLPSVVQFVAAVRGRDAAAAFSARINAW